MIKKLYKKLFNDLPSHSTKNSIIIFMICLSLLFNITAYKNCYGVIISHKKHLRQQLQRLNYTIENNDHLKYQSKEQFLQEAVRLKIYNNK